MLLRSLLNIAVSSAVVFWGVYFTRCLSDCPSRSYWFQTTFQTQRWWFPSSFQLLVTRWTVLNLIWIVSAILWDVVFFAWCVPTLLKQISIFTTATGFVFHHGCLRSEKLLSASYMIIGNIWNVLSLSCRFTFHCLYNHILNCRSHCGNHIAWIHTESSLCKTVKSH